MDWLRSLNIDPSWIEQLRDAGELGMVLGLPVTSAFQMALAILRK